MKKKFSGTEIVGKLREADVLIGQGKDVPEVCREIGVSSQTYYRWRNKYGGMSPDIAVHSIPNRNLENFPHIVPYKCLCPSDQLISGKPPVE